MKNKKLLYGILIVIAFIMTAGLTYAYFSLVVSGNEKAQTMTVSTTTLELKYTDGNEVKAEGIEPGWTMTKTITVENTGNETVYYTLGWQKLYNEIQKNELVIKSTCTTSDTTNGSCDSTENVVIPQTTEVTAETNKVLYPYKEGVKILPGETHTYTVTVEFINYTDKAQNYNQGKDIYGVLGAVEAYNTYNLTLNIKDTEGNAIANSEVTMHSTPMTGTTDSNGVVTFENIELGDHTLNVVNNSTVATANINVSGGANEVIKTNDIFNIKPTKENITLDVTIDDNNVSNIEVPTVMSKYLIENYETLGLTKIEQIATGNQDYVTVEYRYQGANPNNYITFNGEENTWRIIGVFEVQTPKGSGYTKEYKLKLVRNNLGTSAWNSAGTNNWATSSLMTTLNSGDYYSKTNTYASNGLTATAKSQISSTKWYLGNVVWSNGYGTTTEVYTQERSTIAHSGNSQTWDGQVALIYPSDYMYASSGCYNDSTKNGWYTYASSPYTTDYRNTACTSTNWLLDTAQWYWVLSPVSDRSNAALNVHTAGFVSIDNVPVNSGGVRPSLYLSSNVIFRSGDGSADKPFEIN